MRAPAAARAPRILIVKLSSLGDVVHAMPALQDLRAAMPDARIDWVVERAFAPLARRCRAVDRVIASDLRRWRGMLLESAAYTECLMFRRELREHAYDAVLDLQGLAKSGIVARLARLSPTGRRFALANRTEGSGYEALTRWLADVAVPVQARSHAVARSRLLCAQALDYPCELDRPADFGLRALAPHESTPARRVAFVHGTSRADKAWPLEHWIELGTRLNRSGFSVALVHGSEAEERVSTAIAARLGRTEVWPRMRLDRVCDALAGCAGVIGVDSGLSHVAVALGLPHVQLYNFDTAWRTGPVSSPQQRVLYAQPTPEVEPVWQACRQVLAHAMAPLPETAASGLAA